MPKSVHKDQHNGSQLVKRQPHHPTTSFENAQAQPRMSAVKIAYRISPTPVVAANPTSV